MVELTYQMALSTLQTAGLLIGILYYIMDLQNQREDQRIASTRQALMLKSQEQALETRQAQFFMQIYDRFNDSEFWKYYIELRSHSWNDYDDWNSKYGRKNENAFSAFASMASYFDGLGVLANRELIDIGMVDELLHTRVLWFWDTYRYILEEMRKRNNNPRIWPHITILYNKIQTYVREHPELST